MPDARVSAGGALAGFSAIGIYLLFALVAFLRYPVAYDPLHDLLSDLGNPQVNVTGALAYELGTVIASVLILAFAVALGALGRGHDRTAVRLLNVSRVAGSLCGLSLLLVAVFPLGPHTKVHGLCSGALWVSMLFFEVLSAAAFLRMRAVPRWIPCLGIVAALVNLLAIFVIGATVMEWATVALVLAYVGALAALLWRTGRTTPQVSGGP